MLKPFIFIVLLFTMLLHSNLYAQRLDLKLYNAAENGMVAGIGSIFQDSRGWMWFTRTADVIRYDGDQFRAYPISRNATLEFSYRIREVNKKFWILGTPYPMSITGDSLLPLQLTNNRLDVLDHVKHNNVDYVLGIHGISKLENNALVPFIVDSTLKIDFNETLVVYNDSLLISWRNRNFLYVFNLNTKQVFKQPTPVLQMFQDSKKKIYLSILSAGIFAIKEIHVANNAVDIQLEQLYDGNGNDYEKLVTDEQGNIWATSQFKHLLKIAANGNIKTYGIEDGLPNVWFNDIYADREQNIWLAFNGGIARIINTGTNRYSSAENLYFDHISKLRSINERDQVFIFTPKGTNVFYKDSLYKLKHNNKPFIATDILPLKDGYLVLVDSLLYSLSIDTNDFGIHHVKQIANLHCLGIELEKDQHGSIFIATIRGLFMYDQQKLSLLLDDKKYYRSIFIDQKQRLWTGEFTLGLEAYQIVHSAQGVSLQKLPLKGLKQADGRLQKIRTIAADSEGNILAGTRYNGLFYIDLDENEVRNIRHFGKEDGMKGNSIWEVAVDDQDKWWISTNVSIETITKLDDEYFIRDESKIHQLVNPFALTLLGSDRILASSLPGFVVIDKNYTANLPSFSVFITGFNLPDSVFQSDVYANGKIKLNNHQNNIQVSFSANTFVNESEVLYSYQIRGNGSAAWSAFSNNHTVNFSSLKPGSYTFRVKAKDANDVLSNNIAEVSFIIAAAFWQTIWFRLLLIVALAFFFYILYRLRLRQITHLQRMRNAISNNLHDDIGASLSNINILNEMAKRNLRHPDKAADYLSKSGDDIQRISESLSDIVWNINPRYDDLNNLFSRMKRYAADILEAGQIETELNFPAETHGLHMDMDARRDFYLIFKEAINNMLKYSNATKAIIEVVHEQKNLQLRITDNGVGFNANIPSTGNGLKNMQQRANKHKAVFTLITTEGGGTTIELRMKLK